MTDKDMLERAARAIYKKEDFLQMLEEGHIETSSFAGDRLSSRLEFLSDYIFDFTTYDGEIGELFALKAVEVCAAISDESTYEYIKNPDDYKWFLLMCNMPFFSPRINWGTSIRGAWWDTPTHETEINFSSCGLFLNGRQITETLLMPVKQWRDFVCAVCEFAAIEMKKPTQEGRLSRPVGTA